MDAATFETNRHCDAVGVIVYTIDPVLWDIVVLAVPAVQLCDTVPPLELVATERPYDGDVSVKVPPVEFERVTATLVAFTVNRSATEPLTVVRVVEGDDSGIFTEEEKVMDAARAENEKTNANRAPMESRDMIRFMLLDYFYDCRRG